MRGVYTTSLKIAGMTAAKTLILLRAPTGVNIRLLSASITNASNATNQQLEAAIARVVTVGSAGGTSNTPAQAEAGDQASASTVSTNLTTEPTTYATPSLTDEGWASLTGWYWTPQEKEQPIIAAGTYVGWRLRTAPGTSTDICAKLSWREEG